MASSWFMTWQIRSVLVLEHTALMGVGLTVSQSAICSIWHTSVCSAVGAKGDPGDKVMVFFGQSLEDCHSRHQARALLVMTGKGLESSPVIWCIMMWNALWSSNEIIIISSSIILCLHGLCLVNDTIQSWWRCSAQKSLFLKEWGTWFSWNKFGVSSFDRGTGGLDVNYKINWCQMSSKTSVRSGLSGPTPSLSTFKNVWLTLLCFF